MRRKLDELRQTLSGFVEQRESLLLVVSTADLEVPYVIKMLEGLDGASPSDLFLTFADPFVRAPEYAATIVKRLRGQMDAARAKGQVGPFPPLPAICDDEAAAPPARLRAVVDHVSSIVPAGGGHKMIWGLLPLQVADQEGYARVVGEFVPWKGPEPWMRGIRVVARDDRARPFLFPALRKHKAPGVLLYAMDMSPEALNDALVKEAGDRSLPVAERVQALLQVAGLDLAHRRYTEALDKYRCVYDFYASHRAPAMAAVALQGVGDVVRRQGDRKTAKLRYQQGLDLAMQTQALPVMLNLTYAIGDVSLELGDHRDAEGFFGLAERIAGKLMNPYVKAQAMEQQGLARTKLGDAAGAIVVWRGADTLCKTFSYHERRRSVLERLIAAYRSAGMDEERRGAEAELRAVKQALADRAQRAHDHPHPAQASAR